MKNYRLNLFLGYRSDKIWARIIEDKYRTLVLNLQLSTQKIMTTCQLLQSAYSTTRTNAAIAIANP
jgi:hypothetical protein